MPILVQTADHENLLWRRLNAANQIVFDTEGSGLNVRKLHNVGYVFTVGPERDDTFYVPVRHLRGGNYLPGEIPQTAEGWKGEIHPFEKRLAKFAATTSSKLIGHHLKFDLHTCARHGIIWKTRVECTQVNQALIDENARSYSLDSVAKDLKAIEKKGEELYVHMAGMFGGEPNRRAQMGHFWEMAGDDPLAVDYATGDGVSNLDVWEKQQEMLDREDLRRVWDVECRTTRTLFRMEYRGVRIDEERLEEVGKQIKREIAKAIKTFPKDFNVRSPAQIKKLYEDIGFPEDKFLKTDKGNYSFVEEWLDQNPLGERIVRLRKMTNIENSFIVPLLTRHLYNGRVHTTFNQTQMDDYGTVSGRLSSSDPNLQQVPKRDKLLARLFRSVFSPELGHVWSQNDYKQQEFVVFAHYTQAKKLVEGYSADPPLDMHSVVAEMMGVERDPTAKRLDLGKLYGMGVRKLAAKLGVDYLTALRYSKMWDRMLPEGKTFLGNAESVAKARGFVRTILGRRRRLSYQLARKAANGIIQGTSADITKLKMAECDEYFESEGDEAAVTLQVHDELDFSIPKGAKGEKMRLEGIKIMQQFGPDDKINLRVPLKVDATIGSNWAESSFGGH